MTNGGKREGAGRKPGSSELTRMYLTQGTLRLLERIAKERGIKRRHGFWELVMVSLTKGVQTQEPKYLQLAREAQAEARIEIK